MFNQTAASASTRPLVAHSHAQPQSPSLIPSQAPAASALGFYAPNLAAQATPVLSAQGLTKQYAHALALSDVNLEIQRGESVAIMGPSGSGKTTLLHCLAGLILPDSGRVLLHAATQAEPTSPLQSCEQLRRAPVLEVTALTAQKRTSLRRSTFGFVFQQGLLLPELTAVENVALAAMLCKVPRREAMSLAQEWLQQLGVSDQADQRIGELSGGQAQRVAIARAQITNPDIVFADEPTGALDSRTSAEVLDVFRTTTVSRGRTLVMVTHDEQVAASCQRIVRMRDGRIVADSTAVESGAQR